MRTVRGKNLIKNKFILNFDRSSFVTSTLRDGPRWTSTRRSSQSPGGIKRTPPEIIYNIVSVLPDTLVVLIINGLCRIRPIESGVGHFVPANDWLSPATLTTGLISGGVPRRPGNPRGGRSPARRRAGRVSDRCDAPGFSALSSLPSGSTRAGTNGARQEVSAGGN